ncbi:MAG: cell wall-binding repeat-containing protein, partial [Desulfobacterales bacterium]|nr:cell wall-binding repeat-containing protein [Desulfobacterales bacterium]
TGTRAGTLDRLTNANTFYKWTLSEGQRFEATLTAEAGTDFDIYLYGPDGVTPLAWSNGGSYPEHLMWDVTATGTYYIEVVSFSGSGAYGVEFSTVATPAWVATTRSAGGDRYATAISLSQGAFATGSVTTAVLATGQNFPDALSAAGLAGVYHSPVLLTKTASLPAGLVSELERLGAQNVVIVGGEPAVSLSVAGDLVNAGFSVSRVAGGHRYSTSAAVADRIAALKGSAFGKMAFVARGDAFPDALALAPFAYSQGCPVLLTRTSALSSECADAINRLSIQEVYIAGSTAAVSSGVESSLNALPSVTMPVSRLAGANRYETAAVIATKGLEFWWGTAGYVGIATGTDFPDALGGGAVCGSRGGVLLLTDPKNLSAPA